MNTAEQNPADFRLFLQEELMKRCRSNPAYSLRAFAKFLQIDHSALAKMLRSERGIGRHTIQKLSSRLGLDPAKTQTFIRSRKKTQASGAELASDHYQQLALDSFQIISDWYHYAILELMRLDHFVTEPRWIARVLGISHSQANVAIERLQRVGILEITSEGRWIDHSGGYSTTLGGELTASAFRNLQKQVLERALVALEHVPVELRDQTSMTMAIDTAMIPEAKKRITQFRRSLAKFLSRGERRDEVYNLGISLYPISQTKSEG